MKAKVIVGMLMLNSLAPSTLVAAEHNIFHRPYVGMEAAQIHQGFKHGFGKNAFPTSIQNYNAFAGLKFSRFIGIEAGYEWQPIKGMDKVLLAGQQLPGRELLTGAQFEGINSSYKSTHPYIGLFAQCASGLSLGHGKVKLQALLGVSRTTVKATTQRIVTDGGIVSPTLIYKFSKRKFVPIVKLSAITGLTPNLCLKLSVNYRNMTPFKITSNIPVGATIPLILKMRDAFGFGVGLKYTF